MATTLSRLFAWALVGGFVLGSSITGATGPDPDALDSVWVSDSGGLTKVDAESGNPLHRDTSLADATALAIDERGGLIWAFRQGMLTVLNLAGQQQAQIAVPDLDLTGALPPLVPDLQSLEDLYCSQLQPLTGVVLAALLPYAQLTVDEEGAAWLGIGNRLYRFTLQGDGELVLELPQLITALASEDNRDKLWVGQCSTVRIYDRGGDGFYAINIPATPLRSISFDNDTQKLWALTPTGLYSFDVTGALQSSSGLPNGGNLRWVAVNGAGGAWVAGGNGNLWRIKEDGTTAFSIRPFDGALLDALEHITGLAANTRDGSAWVGGYSAIAQVAAQKTVSKKIPLQSLGANALSTVVAISQYADTIPPDVSIASPADGAAIATLRPSIDIRYDDVGSGTDPDTIVLKADGADMPVSCLQIDENQSD